MKPPYHNNKQPRKEGAFRRLPHLLGPSSLVLTSNSSQPTLEQQRSGVLETHEYTVVPFCFFYVYCFFPAVEFHSMDIPHFFPRHLESRISNLNISMRVAFPISDPYTPGSHLSRWTHNAESKPSLDGQFHSFSSLPCQFRLPKVHARLCEFARLCNDPNFKPHPPCHHPTNR